MIIEDQMILDSLSDCNFDELTTEAFESQVFDYCNLDFFEDKYDVGATKGVLYLKEDPTKVIKIPLSHCESEVYIEDVGWEYRCIWLNGASHGNDWNYCGTECDIYREAKKLGLEKYFLRTRYIGSIHSHPIYVQEKADKLALDLVYMTSKERDTLQKEFMGANFYMAHPQWTYDFILNYGIDELVKLQNFLKDYDLDRDLHDGNVGYRCGKPVLIDYSGYNN